MIFKVVSGRKLPKRISRSNEKVSSGFTLSAAEGASISNGVMIEVNFEQQNIRNQSQE